MKEFSPLQINGKTVTFKVASGRVAAVTQRSETRVTGSQGNVRSSISRSTEFSLIDADGIEHPRKFSGHDFFIRGGNRVSIVWVNAGKDSYWNLICNHDTKKSAFVWNYSAYLCSLGLKRKLGCVVPMIVVAAMFLGLWLNEEKGGEIALTSGLLLGIPALIVNWYRGSRIWKTMLSPKLNEIARYLQDNTESIRWP